MPSTDFDTNEPELKVARISTLEEYRNHRESRAEEISRQHEVEEGLLRPEREFHVSGDCHPCGTSSRFHVVREPVPEGEAPTPPNWRETLRCERCLLNNRMRASVHLFERLLAPERDSRIYMTEQVGDLHPFLHAKHPRLVGSEYLPDGASRPRGVRHEDLGALSFASERFDFVLSFDVLEHVPEHLDALGELHRVLRPGGRMLFSVPFLPGRFDNVQRAVLGKDGSVTHLLPPEYHGDPLRPDGCLAYRQFGWELLDELRGIGFARADAIFYWSRRFGYLGENQRLFLAVK